MRIGIVAPSCTLDPTLPERLIALASGEFGDTIELIFHPQCFLSEGHFAGPDEARVGALVETANDPSINAIWFARGGYGACRVAEAAIAQMGPAAHKKLFMGYSDSGYILAGLYKAGIGSIAHGPLAADLNREGGEAAVLRAMRWFLKPTVFSNDGRKYAAFNLTVLSQMIGTPLLPDLTGHVLMIEEVAEYMYRIDRCMYQLTNTAALQNLAGIMLGRCSAVPENDPDFGQGEEDICRFWCDKSGIPYLGRANIGHDADNEVVAFG